MSIAYSFLYFNFQVWVVVKLLTRKKGPCNADLHVDRAEEKEYVLVKYRNLVCNINFDDFCLKIFRTKLLLYLNLGLIDV